MTATTTDTYDQVGIREDLADAIWNVSPSNTPFMSNAPKTRSSQTYHEWQTDSLASAAANAQVEGADPTFAAAAATTRVGNYTQISTKQIVISDTLEATRRAGRGAEMGYQRRKRSEELKTDMENALIGVNNAQVAGNASTARELGSYSSYAATNTDFGGTGADPTGDGTDARTDGTQRAFTESLLETVLDAIWESGGKPDIIMTGSFNKRAANAFTGIATSTFHDAADQSIVSATDVYISDYGQLALVPNRLVRARDCLVYEKDKWAVSFLRDFRMKPIATTGDAEKELLTVEFTLEARNEASSGGVFDLTTS